MKFEFDLGFWDFLGFYGHLRLGTLGRFLKTLLWYCGLGFFFLLLHFNFNISTWWAQEGWNSIIFCLLMAVIFIPMIGLLTAWQMARSARSIGASRLFELSEDGLRQAYNAGVSQQPWKAILRVEESKRLFYFFLSPRMAIILPKRAFSSAEHIESCRQYLKQKQVMPQTATKQS